MIRTDLCLATISLATACSLAQQTASYRVEFDAEWSNATHATSFPGNPHFSPLIGATHTQAVSLWQPGGIATHGIEVMAETGATSTLGNEVNGLVILGDADQFLNFGGIGLSPGIRSGSFEASADFPLVSLVSMIAPSPDWFVGIHGVDLRPGGVWVRELIFDLAPYDSGTDAGVNYTSGNSDINPHIPIADISGIFPFTGHGRIGTLRLVLTSPAACTASDLAEPYEVLDLADINAFVTAFTGMDAAADLAAPAGVFDLADISAFVESFGAGCP